MGKRPGIYHDIGWKSRDVLYKDYPRQPTDYYQFHFFDWSFLLSGQSGDLLPGFRTALRMFVPFQRDNEVEVQYLHDYAGITGGMSVSKEPFFHFSGVIGRRLFCIGTDMSFDSVTKTFSKCNAGLSFKYSFLHASLTMTEKGDALTASSYLSMSHGSNTALAAEVTRRFSTSETVFTVGAQHELFSGTMVKARANTFGKVGAVVQREFLGAVFLTTSGEVDVKDLMSSKFGVSFSLSPQDESKS